MTEYLTVIEKSSLLTKGQREKLTDDDEEFTHPNKAAERIRKRVYAGLRDDGSVLFEKFSRKERRDIFTEWQKDLQNRDVEEYLGKALIREEVTHHSPETPEELEQLEKGYFREGLTNLLAFLYLGIEEGNVGDFESILQSALERAARETDRTLNEFDLSVEMAGLMNHRPETIAELVREDEPDLTIPELELAYEKGAISQEELENYLGELTDVVGFLDE